MTNSEVMTLYVNYMLLHTKR